MSYVLSIFRSVSSCFFYFRESSICYLLYIVYIVESFVAAVTASQERSCSLVFFKLSTFIKILQLQKNM